MAQLDTIAYKNGDLQNGSKVKEVDPIKIVVTRQVIEAIVQAHDPSLVLIDFNAEAGSAIGDNYMTNMYLVNIKTKNNQNGDAKQLSVMLKTLPLNPARQAMANDSLAFVKEALMYEKVFPGFESIQKDLGFTPSEMYSDYPRLYISFVNGKSDYLALENLRTSGYKMADRQKGLDKDHVTVFLKSLAKFHALSYAQFHGSHEAILQVYPELKEKLWVRDSQSIDIKMTNVRIKWRHNTILENIKALRQAGFDAEASILEGPDFHIDSILTKMDQFVSKPAKYSVLGHGDCWTNNMLFKYDERTGKPIGIKLIDFQISRPCSRAIDLHYFLLPCPQDDLVNDCEEEFLRIYYDEFSSFAKKLGFFEPELTFEQLQEEYNEYRGFSIINSLITLKFFYAKSEDVKDVKAISGGDLSEEVVDEEFFKGMINDVVIRKIRNVLNVHLPKVKPKIKIR